MLNSIDQDRAIAEIACASIDLINGEPLKFTKETGGQF
jgi:hypothetical protein